MVAGCDRAGWHVDTGRAATAALTLGTVTVAAAAVTASSLIFLAVIAAIVVYMSLTHEGEEMALQQ